FLALGVSRVVALGAFIGQVAHTLPVPLIGSSSRPETVAAWGLLPSNYEGPTGIVGVLTSELSDMGIETIAVWAAVPHYLSNQDYPPGTRALMQKAAELLGVSFDTAALDSASLQYLSTVNGAAANNHDLAEYVRRLEEEADDIDTAATMRLVEATEDFLREQSYEARALVARSRSLVALVAIRLEPLPILVLGHLLAALLDERAHSTNLSKGGTRKTMVPRNRH